MVTGKVILYFKEWGRRSVLNIEYRIQDTEYRIQNRGYRIVESVYTNRGKFYKD